jgi:hypothetical protein
LKASKSVLQIPRVVKTQVFGMLMTSKKIFNKKRKTILSFLQSKFTNLLTSMLSKEIIIAFLSGQPMLEVLAMYFTSSAKSFLFS